MANPLCNNLKENIKHKRYSLYQYGMGIIFFVVLYIYTHISDRPLCLLKNLAGVSCFGCGMTRGFIAILRLDFAAAFKHNALAVPLFLGIVVHAALLLVDVLFGKDHLDKFEYILSRKWMYILYGLLLIVGMLGNNGLLF